MMWTVEAHFYVCHHDLYENQINNIMSYAQVKAHDKDEVEMKHTDLWTKKARRGAALLPVGTVHFNHMGMAASRVRLAPI